MGEILERVETLERRQKAILNATRWDRFPLDIRSELMDEKREKSITDNEPHISKKERERQAKEKKEREELEACPFINNKEIDKQLTEQILEAKNGINKLYIEGKITKEEAQYRYIFIGTSRWNSDIDSSQDTSVRQQRIQEMDEGNLFI